MLCTDNIKGCVSITYAADIPKQDKSIFFSGVIQDTNEKQ